MQRAAEITPGSFCHFVFFTEEFENGDAGLARAIIIGTILANSLDELSDCRVEANAPQNEK
jgi:hypothetical protein